MIALRALMVSIPKVVLMFLGDFRDPSALLRWESIDNSLYCLDESTLLVRASVVIICNANITSPNLSRRKAMCRYRLTSQICVTTQWR